MHSQKKHQLIRMNSGFLFQNFERVLNAVCSLPADSPASEFYMPTFHKPSSFYTHLPAYEDGRDRVFRNVGI